MVGLWLAQFCNVWVNNLPPQYFFYFLIKKATSCHGSGFLGFKVVVLVLKCVKDAQHNTCRG